MYAWWAVGIARVVVSFVLAVLFGYLAFIDGVFVGASHYTVLFAVLCVEEVLDVVGAVIRWRR